MGDGIRANLGFLATNLSNVDEILLHLVEKEIISEKESDEIKSVKASLKQNEKLLTIIQKNDLPPEIFLDMLRKTNNEQCAKAIEGTSVEKPDVLIKGFKAKKYSRILTLWKKTTWKMYFTAVICLSVTFATIVLLKCMDRYWDTGKISSEQESMNFFKQNLEVQYTELQLKELCRLLGNVTLAKHLAVAALNKRKIDLENYIEKLSTAMHDVEDILDGEFDEYEKIVNASVSISLQLIINEKYGDIAQEIITVFGYIRSDYVPAGFFREVLKCNITDLSRAMELLLKYSFISTEKEFNKESRSFEESEVSIHQLLQQVIRHNAKYNERNCKKCEFLRRITYGNGFVLPYCKSENTFLRQEVSEISCRCYERETLKNIFCCKGFAHYKVLPFIKYADKNLRKEFPKFGDELIHPEILGRFVKEKRFDESVLLAKFIDGRINSSRTKFNFAICLELNGQLEEGIKGLEELYKEVIKEKMDYFNTVEFGLLSYWRGEATKQLIGGHLLVSHWKLDNKERLQEILEERKSFVMIYSEEMMISLLKIVNSNLIQSNYTLTTRFSVITFEIVLDGGTKKIELEECSVDLSVPLPNDLQELILYRVKFKNGNYAKDYYFVDISEWLPKKLSRVEIVGRKCPIFLSLESISSAENITLSECSLSLDSGNRISPRNLRLLNVSFVENKRELSNAKINEFIDFHKMKTLELLCWNKKNVSIDLSEESANVEHIYLDSVNALSLKSMDGKVNIKKVVIRSSLEILILSDTNFSVSGGIDLPNLKYLKLVNTPYSSHFRSLQLTSVFLSRMQEVNVDLLPPRLKTLGIERGKEPIRLQGGLIHLDKLILDGFPSTEVEEIVLPHFHLKQLVLYYDSHKPLYLIQLMEKQIPSVAIGRVYWRANEFKNFNVSNHVDRQSEFYLFHEGKGKAIQWKDFDELCERA